ncbi:MAG: TetR/AcrR family transcriptional regulator [Spirochaetaceae bacterium]|jgi:AcrR family transcriptional regulator|nr:TetR/AcrR family transcriptional regulator [Spirochaetaceae bacterium]
MAIVVEHEKRRKQILKKALDVFMDEGFENTTCQKIADRCKITRTTLYMYFRNKREIFNYSIKQFLADAERDILRIKEDTSLPYPDKIKKTLSLIIARLEDNRRLLSLILDYLLPVSAPEKKVRRRTIRLRRILAAMLIDGIKAGQLKKIQVEAADNLFYGLIESALFRLAVLKRDSVAELRKAVDLAVNGLSLDPSPEPCYSNKRN